ncbi:MAG: component of SufBCD complex [Pseudomonadota bacterium]
MDWYLAVFELIDMRSFSNLWYWIGLAIMWSTASHFVLGVPFDMVLRAKRQGGQSEIDLVSVIEVNVRRIRYIGQVSGIWIIGIGSALLTTLAILGFVYWVEFAQALFFLAFPMTIVGLMSLRTARLLSEKDASDPEAMRERLTKHRFRIQLLGVASIFVTSLFGMWQNIAVGPLGG